MANKSETVKIFSFANSFAAAGPIPEIVVIEFFISCNFIFQH